MIARQAAVIGDRQRNRITSRGGVMMKRTLRSARAAVAEIPGPRNDPTIRVCRSIDEARVSASVIRCIHIETEQRDRARAVVVLEQQPDVTRLDGGKREMLQRSSIHQTTG